MRARIAILVICVAGMLAFASAAFATTTPSQDAYGPQPQGGVQGVGTGGGGTPGGSAPATVAHVQSSGSSLPFTGLQAGLVLVAGAALVGTGVVIRRAGHKLQ